MGAIVNTKQQMMAPACTLWRTGSVLNRSFTATVVPTALAVGAVPTSVPVWSYVSRWAGFVLAVRVVIETLARAHKLLSASPLNPNVLIAWTQRLCEHPVD